MFRPQAPAPRHATRGCALCPMFPPFSRVFVGLGPQTPRVIRRAKPRDMATLALSFHRAPVPTLAVDRDEVQVSKKSAENPDLDAMTDPARPPAVVHVDLDGISEIAEAWGWSVPEGPDTIFQTGLEAALDLFERNSVRATLFTVARSLDDPAKRALIERAVEAGHEIGSHTVTHPNLRKVDRETKLRELADSRRLLEQELGVEVSGFRAPGYRLDREGLEVLGEAGYAWDSSGFPTKSFAEHFGVDVDSLTHPSFPLADFGVGELPLPDHRPFPVPFNPSYSILMGMTYLRWGLRRAARRGRPTVLLFHLIDFARPLPKEMVPGLRGRIFTLSTHSQARKLRCCQVVIDELQARFDLMSTADMLERVA